MNQKYTTYLGIDLLQTFKDLDQELEPNAYKQIEGGKGATLGLTDIQPAYLPDLLNRLFGPIGLAWGFDVFNLKFEATEKDFLAECTVKPWYLAVPATGDPIKVSLPEVPGSSKNSVLEWARKGAVTNALGTAWFFAGWQISVYMGKRSHKEKKPYQKPQGDYKSQPSAKQPATNGEYSPSIKVEPNWNKAQQSKLIESGKYKIVDFRKKNGDILKQLVNANQEWSWLDRGIAEYLEDASEKQLAEVKEVFLESPEAKANKATYMTM